MIVKKTQINQFTKEKKKYQNNKVYLHIIPNKVLVNKEIHLISVNKIIKDKFTIKLKLILNNQIKI